MDRDELNALPAKRIGGEPADEAEHCIVCPSCGQAIDCRNLGDVLYHEEPGHEWLPSDA